MKTKLLTFAFVGVFGLVSCINDELKEVYKGEEITFTSRVTRATPTTLENLDTFRVYADAEGYNEFFIKGLKAGKKKTGSGDYVLESTVTWPSDVNRIRFWAYGPNSLSITPDFAKTTQLLKNFEAKSNLEKGGVEHKDLVVAYANITRDQATGTQVPLKFEHALSQIEIKIKKGDGFEEGRVVKVKGAWLINAHSHGDLECDFVDFENGMKWSTSTPANYGRTLSTGTRLGNGIVEMISNGDNGGEHSSLMLPPQQFVKWSFDEDTPAQASTDAPNRNLSGTYILVLCRVETEHRTSENEELGNSVGELKNEDGNVIGHIHQLFPVTKDDAGDIVYDETAYGYSCVPIAGEWLPGKKYIYTLNFCGKDSGAGVYPPEPLPDGLPEGEKRPDDKKPGDPVLDDPISFSVEISEWTEEPLPTPMG